MLNSMNLLTFPVPLGYSVRNKAQEFQHYQANTEAGWRIYLNTLATYAVDFYLKSEGFESNLKKSDSWNPVMQKLMGVADLQVEGFGKLECIPSLKDLERISVSPIALSNRVGYVFVQFNESFTEARITGFVKKLEGEEILLNEIELESLENLPEHLYEVSKHDEIAAASLTESNTTLLQVVQDQLGNAEASLAVSEISRIYKQEVVQRLVNLSAWLEDVVEETWLPAQHFFEAERFNTGVVGAGFGDDLTVLDGRSELIVSDEQGGDLVLTIVMGEGDEEVDVLVDLRPREPETTLPLNIKLASVYPGKKGYQAVAKEPQEFLQLRFLSSVEKTLNIQISIEDVGIIKDFQT